ncbi:MAG: DUF3313 domain-containing protein [Comamonadaceae bacterium]|nr:DUF3313 domain-containing protein [Comamonadaceae bacterium]
MKLESPIDPSFSRPAVAAFVLAGCALFSGCATNDSMTISGTGITATDSARLTRSGFLSDFARLKPTTWGQGIECWRDSKLDARSYDKVLISRIVVSLAPAKAYFHNSLVQALKPQMQVVDKAGPGVLVMRIALTDLVPTVVTDSLAGTLIPYAFVAEAGSGVATGRPAGSTPYMGETGMEMQFRDGATGAVLGECRDTEIGRKYAADVNAGAAGAAQTWVGGYLNSFQAWSYARNAFDKWSSLVAQRLAQLRGASRRQSDRSVRLGGGATRWSAQGWKR